MARDSKIEKKNENRGIDVKWNMWDAHESSFPCYFCAVAAGKGESENNCFVVVIVKGIIHFAE